MERIKCIGGIKHAKTLIFAGKVKFQEDKAQ